jgi:DNA helicase HerA-like ATPase
MRSTVIEFGPILLSRILNLNDTQAGVVSMIFKYCDDNQMPLMDLKDFIKVIQYISNEGKKEVEALYGKISTSSTGTILRKVIELQQQGADVFFGEPSFDIEDLMRISDDGRGMVNVMRVTDMQSKPKLFSTFMLSLLAELYALMPEEGDMDNPKLVMLIDEAHLVFQEASEVLLQQMETVIKLIRSKGVGVIFITQNPADIPNAVLSQLGMKVQHALRAFTAKDRKDIKAAAENYPLSDFYKTDSLLTELGIGEALVTVLNEKGIPSPLVHCMMAAPGSRMDVLTPAEINAVMEQSQIAAKYNREIDPDSAYEMLTAKMETVRRQAEEVSREQEEQAAEEAERKRTASGRPRNEKSTLEKVANSSVGRTIVRELTRGLLGVLGIKSTTRRRKSLF